MLKKIMSGISWLISKVKAAYVWAASEETQAKAQALYTKIREIILTHSRKVVVLVQRAYLVKELVLEGLGGKENFRQVMAKVRAEVKATVRCGCVLCFSHGVSPCLTRQLMEEGRWP